MNQGIVYELKEYSNETEQQLFENYMVAFQKHSPVTALAYLQEHYDTCGHVNYYLDIEKYIAERKETETLIKNLPSKEITPLPDLLKLKLGEQQIVEVTNFFNENLVNLMDMYKGAGLSVSTKTQIGKTGITGERTIVRTKANITHTQVQDREINPSQHGQESEEQTELPAIKENDPSDISYSDSLKSRIEKISELTGFDYDDFNIDLEDILYSDENKINAKYPKNIIKLQVGKINQEQEDLLENRAILEILKKLPATEDGAGKYTDTYDVTVNLNYSVVVPDKSACKDAIQLNQ